MSIIKNLIGIREIRGPIFYKDFSDENNQIRALTALSEKVKSDKKKYIDRDIALMKVGLQGEKNVYYELKNSFIPMICLHDIRIQEDDYVAQFDFIVITAQFIMILETKKLNGDIYINQYGDFIRSVKDEAGRVIRREGIYSPITQNDRHVKILKDVLLRNKVIKYLDVISGVVIANPKCIVNRGRAPFKVKNEIVRHDQLIEFISRKIKQKKVDMDLYDDSMKNIANFILKLDTKISINNIAKYSLTEEDFEEASKNQIDQKSNVFESTCNKRQINIILQEKLNQYRARKSREEGSKAYFIFNNDTLQELIRIKPKDKNELLKVKGFGFQRVQRYGDEIINIIEKINT